LISDRFWRRRFGADPNALGKKLRVNGFSSSIVGVMPASFLFPDRDVDLWSAVPPDAPIAQSREWTWYLAIGRLKPGVTLEQARANLATVQKQLGIAFPKTDADLIVAIEPLKEMTIGGVRRSLLILYGSVSLLLLIACTNIVALLLARAAQRQHEISVRFSLGGSRTAIVSQLLTEVFVLLLAGAGLLLRSFQELGRVSPGFDASHVLTFHISASYAETADWKGLTQRIDRTIDSLGSLPGVETAATDGTLPGVPSHFQIELNFSEGQQDTEHKIVAESRFVSPAYFATMRIPILSGELCRESPDSLKSINVMVNRSF